MNTRLKVILAALTAALVLSLAAGTASALRSLSIAGSTTLSLNGIVTFETAGNFEVICPITVIKTISRVIPKIVGTLMGQVTEVRTAEPKPEARCSATGARLEAITILNLERPEEARIFYEGILGTLPAITGILATLRNFRASFRAEEFGVPVTCLYTPEAPLPVTAPVSRGVIGDLVIGVNRARRISGGFLCPTRGVLKGTLRPLQLTTIILI